MEFGASYQHVDDLGNTNTSLISTVRTHELNHLVRITVPSDDNLPDFLVNDTTNVDALPNVVYSSDGTTNLVSSIGVTNCSSAFLGNNVFTVTVTNPPAGWGYFEIVDPMGGNSPITNVQNSLGVNLLVGPNVWQTPQRPDMAPPKPYNLIHIFDYNSTGSYTVMYGQPITAPYVATLTALNITSSNAELNAVVCPNGAATQIHFEWGATTNYGFSTEPTTLIQDLYSTQAVALAVGILQPTTIYHYRVVAINSAGTSYGEDAILTTAAIPPPVITPVLDRSINDGQSIVITNQAVAANPPVTWSLDVSAPAGATISSNGVFTWIPTCAQGSSTNQIKIWATDSSSPPLSNWMAFTVTVGECVEVDVGSTVVQVGQTTNVPVTLASSLSLTNLNFTLLNPANRLTNWSFASSNASIASVTLQMLGSSGVYLNFSTFANQTLQSNLLLGTISFSPLPGHSAFLPLAGTNIVGLADDGSTVGNATTGKGRVVVIGQEPLLEGQLSANSGRTLILYGNPGTNYQVLFSTNAMGGWQNGQTTLMTNLMDSIPLGDATPQIFYRAKSQ